MDYEEQAMEEERYMKRAYLKEEIISKGFLPQDFIDYCEAGRGADLDIYTLQDLQELVEEFKVRQTAVVTVTDPNDSVVPQRKSGNSIGPFDLGALPEDDSGFVIRRERHSLLFDESVHMEAHFTVPPEATQIHSEPESEARPNPESQNQLNPDSEIQPNLAIIQPNIDLKRQLSPVQEEPTVSEGAEFTVEDVEAVDSGKELRLDEEPIQDTKRRLESLKQSVRSKAQHSEASECIDLSYSIQVQQLPDTELSQARGVKVTISE